MVLWARNGHVVRRSRMGRLARIVSYGRLVRTSRSDVSFGRLGRTSGTDRLGGFAPAAGGPAAPLTDCCIPPAARTFRRRCTTHGRAVFAAADCVFNFPLGCNTGAARRAAFGAGQRQLERRDLLRRPRRGRRRTGKGRGGSPAWAVVGRQIQPSSS